jgi:hypothetical protein
VIAMAASLVRILIVLLVVRFVLRFLVSVVEGYRGTPPRGRGAPPPPPATDLVRDRVCDTFVPRSRALVATVNGKEQHFCSPACRDRARAAGSA